MSAQRYDAVVVGAGFAGMYMLYKLRLLGLSARVYETGDDVGGTWYWNRYPGARCDVESMEYSYSFDEQLEQEWDWSERYPAQPEILGYAQHVAQRYDLRRDIQFETRVTSAHYDDITGRWKVRTDRGDKVSAEYFITAVGCLSASNVPDLPGLDTFQGEVAHTGRYPKEGIDFSGKRVGVVGTGSSGIQAIPVIAETAGHLTVFQRTAQYSIPARNEPLAPEVQEAVKADYRRVREENRAKQGALGARFEWNEGSIFEDEPEQRQKNFEERWQIGGFSFLGAYGDVARNVEANDIAADFVKEKIRETVRDPAVADRLMPHTHIGCKRLCLDTDYFETYNRPNVTLVDISENPITEIDATGLVTGGEHHDLDVIVFATGYDAMTGSLLRMDIRGRDALPLAEQWYAGPVNYLGLGVPGFPNLFTVTGPGSPSVLANMIVCIEQHGDWIADCIEYLRANDYRHIEATVEAADAWVAHVNAVADFTLYPTCNSWYLGANIPGKPRVFMPLPGFPAYAERCDEVAAKGYEGFTLSR